MDNKMETLRVVRGNGTDFPREEYIRELDGLIPGDVVGFNDNCRPTSLLYVGRVKAIPSEGMTFLERKGDAISLRFLASISLTIEEEKINQTSTRYDRTMLINDRNMLYSSLNNLLREARM